MGTADEDDGRARALFAAVAGADDDAVARGAADASLVDRVVGFASDPVAGRELAEGERPRCEAGAHPVRLFLHALARQHQYATQPTDLGSDYLEALALLLDERLDAWAGAAALEWARWLLFQSEASGGWRLANELLRRHPATRLPARACAALAGVAERAGATEDAVELWQLARSHRDVVTSARTSALVDTEWARTHLMLSGGAPARAAFVQRRVQDAFAAWHDEAARIMMLNAAMECAFAAVIAGDPAGGLAGSQRTLERLADDVFLLPWLLGARSLAHALLGELTDAERALDAAGAAVADTSTLELAATLPARMVVAARRGDVPAIDVACDRARSLEQARDVDGEQAVSWRIFALLSLLIAGRTAAARRASLELRDRVANQRVAMPVQAAHAALLDGAAHGDEHAVAAARATLGQHGVVLAPGGMDAWGVLDRPRPAAPTRPRATAGHCPVLRIEVLDGFRVREDGVEVDGARWGSRRKAKLALALLAAAGGRLERRTLVEALWRDETDPATSGARLSTVLSAMRAVIAAGRSPEAPRALLLDAAVVELRPAPGDSIDLSDLRAVVRHAAAADPRDAGAQLRAAARVADLATGTPLATLGTEDDEALTEARAALVGEVVGATEGVARRWLRATGEHRDVPPSSLLQLVERACLLDPLEEGVAAAAIELFGRSERVADASRTFHRLKDALDAQLGVRPSASLVRLHARVLAGVAEH